MQVARVTDQHEGICDHGQICCPHSVVGSIIGGSDDVFTNNLQQARDGDLVSHNCPHCGTGHIVASSATVFVNGKAVARLGDTVIYPGGNGMIASASDDVFSG